MDNQPAPTQSTQPMPAPVTSQPKSRKSSIVFAWLLVVLLLGGVAGVYYWQHGKVSDLNDQVTSLKASSAQQSTKNPAATTTSTTTATTTDTLPNGTKVSYPLTTGNANVVWWSDGNTTPAPSNAAADGYMRVTDKRVIQFLSTIPTDVIQKLCTSEWDNETGFMMGVYDTNKKELILHNQYQNCIDAVAADKDGKYTEQAQQVLTDSTNDLNAWAKSLTVSK